MEAFDLQGLQDARARQGGLWLEFVRSRDLSAGIYELAAGMTDPQSPHSEDELYHVIRGRATIMVGDEDREVGPGSLVFVPARVSHRFHGIEEDLTILVVFGPAEHSRAAISADPARIPG